MQGWRSIMHGSPQQGSGARMSAVAAHKNGLDLAWRLNGVPPTFLACLAGTSLFLPLATVHSLWPMHRRLWRLFQACIRGLTGGCFSEMAARESMRPCYGDRTEPNTTMPVTTAILVVL